MRQKKATYCKIYTYAPELRYNNYLRRPKQDHVKPRWLRVHSLCDKYKEKEKEGPHRLFLDSFTWPQEADDVEVGG